MKTPHPRSRLSAGILALLFALVLPLAGRADAPPAVKLLTVGNSFADNAAVFLPSFAKAGGKNLVLVKANLPGHSLQQHASYLQAWQADPADPKGSPYAAPAALKAQGKQKVSLADIVASDKWTWITIQQYSALSYKEETYEPYAGLLVDFLRKNEPGAEILVQETWAYREDEPLFRKEGFTQQKMYDQLKANYEKLAARYGLRLIPSGDAFQLARATPRWTFVPDAAYDFANPPEGLLPQESGALNQGWSWQTNKETGRKKLVLDGHHANVYGQYLIAAVWYETLFKENVEANPFVPPAISPEDAAQLRHFAHEAVAARNP
ncbi:MAG TPA: DUF4886 domain-containing protein [Candidatus Methylacidiphilales bacterium]